MSVIRVAKICNARGFRPASHHFSPRGGMSTEYPKPTLRPGPPSDAARAIEGERAESCERAAEADEAAGVPLLALYVDDDVYVLNKPAQTYVHDIERLVERGIRMECDDATVDNRATTRDAPFNASESACVMHRLDRDTSGCLVVARNRDAIRSLSAQFADGTVQKTYVALCAATADYDGVEENRRIFTGWGRAKYGLFRLYDAADVGRALPGNKKVKHAETTIIVERVITDGVTLRFCEPASDADAERRRHPRRVGAMLPAHRSHAPDQTALRIARTSTHRRREIRRTDRHDARRTDRRAVARAPRRRRAAPRRTRRLSPPQIQPPRRRPRAASTVGANPLALNRSSAFVSARASLAPRRPLARVFASRAPRRRPRLARAMVSAVHGVMITADVPIKQYILHLNDAAPAERKFVVVDLDARRVLVQPDAVDAIRREIEAFQRSTRYVAPLASAKP